MPIKKKVVFFAGVAVAAAVLVYAGFLIYSRYFSSSFSPAALLRDYAITVEGDSLSVTRAEMQKILEGYVDVPDVVAYYSAHFWPWESQTTLSAEEAYILSVYEGLRPKELLEEKRGKILQMELSEKTYAITEK